ncbi:MAG: inner membrane protein YpjD [Opitutales bacterium]
MTDQTAFALATLFYLFAFGYGLIALLCGRTQSRPVQYTLLAGAFLLQTLGLSLRGAEIQACPLGNIFEIAHFIAWSIVLLFFIIGPIFKLRLLSFFTAGLAALLSVVVFLVPAWDASYPAGIFGGNPWIELHAALAIFSYGVFATLALISTMFLIQQYGLKHKQAKGLYAYLPSVQQLDTMAKRLLLTGVGVLSAALFFGAVFWMSNPDRVPLLKLTITCMVWAGYITVVVLRLRRKLVTRRHAVAAIALFLFALASLWPVQTAREGKRPTPEKPVIHR